MNTVKALTILLELKKVLDSLGIKFWLDGGTLLGAYRENGFMESDFDIDLGMYGEDDNKIDNIVNGLKELGFTHFHIKKHPCGEGKQISWVKDEIPGDIFIYYKRGDKRFRVMFDITPYGTVKFIPCVYPAYLFDKFKTIDFMDYGVEFNMLSPVEEYLTLQYGDWRLDKGKNEFHWQTDYKSYDPNFEISPRISGKQRWVHTNKLIAEEADGSFFLPLIKEGYKLYPIIIDENLKVIDGKKRLQTYKQLGNPMVEVICTRTQ